MTTTPKLGIPFISGQQAQPEVTHNQAILVLQTLLLGVLDTLASPPGSPADGDSYIIDASPTGAWSGHANKIAVWYGGWLFVPGVDDDGAAIPMDAEQKGLSVYSQGASAVLTWSGTVWAAAGGGGAGTPPMIVQSGAENAGAQGITLGGAPANGNLLVAMFFNASTDAVGSGWTKIAENSSGTDYGVIATKTAGGAESATQNPIGSAPGTGCIAMWELHGAASVVTTTTQAEQSGLSGATGALPMPANMIFLAACGLVSASNSITAAYNVETDHLLNTGSGRQIVAGHADAGSAAFAQLFAIFSGSGTPGNKSSGILITA